MMNGYKAFYRGKSVEVYADTSYQAQQKAVAKFKAKKSWEGELWFYWEVTVVLCEKNGESYAQSSAAL
jgi:hypothetical protein